jgi:protein O-mannosyl-transferase
MTSMSATRRTALPIFLLVLSIWAVFFRLASANFLMWDDRDMLWNNPRLVPPSLAKTAGFWTTPCLKLYTPMSYTMWAAGVALENRPPGATLTPGPFHVLSILLHTAAAVFLFLLLRELTGTVWPAWAGAMLFAIHPLQVEPVAWIAPMNGLLCGAFGLAALWQYVVYAKSTSGGARHLTFAALLYAAALLSKPTAVVLPLIAAVLQFFTTRRSAIPILIGLAMAIPIMVVTRIVQPLPSLPHVSAGGRILVAIDAIGFYFTKLVWPVGLTADYERTPTWVLAHLSAIWPGVAVVAGGLLLALAGKRTRWIWAPLIIVPAALLPVLGLTPFDFQYYSTVADRYMYLPMIGIALIFTLALQKCGRFPGAAIAAAVLIVLCVLSFQQTEVWQDTGTLTAQQLRFDPKSSTGHKHRAEWLAGKNMTEAAEDEFRAAIAALESEGRTGEGGVWYGYGNLLLKLKRYPEAIAIYQQGLPRMSDDQKPLGHNNLGIALFQMGDRDAARQEFITALSLDPNLNQAKQNLARIGSN